VQVGTISVKVEKYIFKNHGSVKIIFYFNLLNSI